MSHLRPKTKPQKVQINAHIHCPEDMLQLGIRGCIIFWPCLFCGWVFSRFLPHNGNCLSAPGVAIIRHFLTLLCDKHFRKNKNVSDKSESCAFGGCSKEFFLGAFSPTDVDSPLLCPAIPENREFKKGNSVFSIQDMHCR